MADDPSNGGLIARLRSIVGRRYVLTDDARTRRYSSGYRFGSGPVAAVVRPGSLVEQWRVFVESVRSGYIVIVQAANTGLTGGSTPFGEYDRSVVVVSTTRITGIHLICGGEQVICLAGATLHALERRLAPIGREPHSVIGSSCIGASVVGGVCNNSGGALIRRGPAYTEYALYGRVDPDGTVRLCNHLGLELGTDPERMLAKLESGCFSDADLIENGRRASDGDYQERVRDIDAATPARFNANPANLYEASGSAGKIMVFAVRLDTFLKDAEQATFYIGTNNPADLTRLRREMLSSGVTLPISAEYIHREAFDLAARYGKDVFIAIDVFGTERLSLLFAARDRIDALAKRFGVLPRNLSDHLLQWMSGRFPNHLPARMRYFRDKYEHYLILKAGGAGVEEARRLLTSHFPSAYGDMFECSIVEAHKAFLHRFAVAAAAVRYRAVHRDRVADLLSLDVALRRNEQEWFEVLPDWIERHLVQKLYYGHFFCHVLHQDYLVAQGASVDEIKQIILGALATRGAEYPAEHNVGHQYPATEALAQHYRNLDPSNSLNPGIGHTSRRADWAPDRCADCL